jgi:hypothetical protein
MKLFFILFFFSLAIIANAQSSETKIVKLQQFEMKGCIQLFYESEKLIKNQPDFLQAIRNDAGREKCLKDLKTIDFDKNSLFGIEINSGYCRYPLGLNWKAIEDTTKKEFLINISYLKPDGLCRALSQYDLWLLLPKIPTDYQIKHQISAREK